MKPLRHITALLAACALVICNPLNAAEVWVLKIEGAIGPATSDYVLRGFARAEAAGASAIVLQMDTPGGLDGAMRDIISSVLDSDIPVISYVGPKGARAASAGTYISYAAHVAAMAPATNLGAATPVQIGAPGLPGSSDAPDDGEPAPASDGSPSAMEKKIVNDAAAYIRGLANLRSRNAEWAELAVREAVSLTAGEALEQNVIDLVAADIPALLIAVSGLTVSVTSGDITLDIAGAAIHVEAPDWRTELLTIITNPNIVLILGMMGVYGIILEFYNPGSLIPGTVGIICLILAGYALNLLPINYAGLGLLLVGLLLMIGEAFMPSFGVLGIGGIIAFLIGGLMLFDTEVAAFQIGWPTLAAVGTITALLLVATIQIALRMRAQKVLTGVDTLVGERGTVLSEPGQSLQIRVGPEIWAARAETDSGELNKGDEVIVNHIDGLTLTVRQAN